MFIIFLIFDIFLNILVLENLKMLFKINAKCSFKCEPWNVSSSDIFSSDINENVGDIFNSMFLYNRIWEKENVQVLKYYLSNFIYGLLNVYDKIKSC